MDSTIRKLLQFPSEAFYTYRWDLKLPYIMLIVLETVLLGVACIQMIRFCHCSNIYLKKIIHILIAFQLIASISLELEMSKLLGVHTQPYILFTMQEATFLFSGLAYFTVFLFWVDFNTKISSSGSGIKFLQTHLFAGLVFGCASIYITGFVCLHYYFVEDIHQGWKLSFKIIWWHLIYYCTITPLQLYYSYRIQRSLDKYYLAYSLSLHKTKKILHAVNFCFLLRTLSVIMFIGLYLFSNNNEEIFLSTWPAFFCFYVLDQILPAALFMFLLRKSPKEHSHSLNDSKLAFLNNSSSSGSFTSSVFATRLEAGKEI